MYHKAKYIQLRCVLGCLCPQSLTRNRKAARAALAASSQTHKRTSCSSKGVSLSHAPAGGPNQASTLTSATWSPVWKGADDLLMWWCIYHNLIDDKPKIEIAAKDLQKHRHSQPVMNCTKGPAFRCTFTTQRAKQSAVCIGVRALFAAQTCSELASDSPAAQLQTKYQTL